MLSRLFIQSCALRVPRTARTLATIAPGASSNTSASMQTLSTTSNVVHQHEHAPNGVSTESNSNDSHVNNSSPFVVSGSAGETQKFGNVPMGAYFVSQSFSE